MEASSVGKCEYGGKGRWVKYWARLGCWISPCYRLSSLGARFETYESFISLIFKFFFGQRYTADNWNLGYWISGYGGTTVLSFHGLVDTRRTPIRSSSVLIKIYSTWQSKRVCAPDDYSTKNTQNYFKQFQALTMITYLELGITYGVSVSLVSPLARRSVAKQSNWAK
jgi:hypothetical protein